MRDLIEASGYGNLEIVKDSVEIGRININAKNEDGETALSRASMLEELEIVKYLIEHGANINAKDEDGNTALMWASLSRNLEFVKYLIENGADVNIKNNNGKTALDMAESEEIKEVLRKAGAK